MFNLLNTETHSKVMCVLLCVCVCGKGQGGWNSGSFNVGGGESQQAGVDSAIIRSLIQSVLVNCSENPTDGAATSNRLAPPIDFFFFFFLQQTESKLRSRCF